MPKANIGGIGVYYEVHGDGEPFTVINGHGGSVPSLYPAVRVYAGEFRLVLFDNRGAGRSDAPDIPYTMEMMADDLAGLLDAIGVGPTHLMGISMGGMIAQHVALRHPDMVRSLVLGSTHCGGPVGKGAPDAEAARVIGEIDGWPARERAREFLRLCVTPEFALRHPDMVERTVALLSEQPAVHHGLRRQREAMMRHHTSGRLPEITAPTLVLHGGADRIVPVDNARALASGIPGAELVIFPGAGHMLLEAHMECTRAVLGFLRRHRAGAGGSPAA